MRLALLVLLLASCFVQAESENVRHYSLEQILSISGNNAKDLALLEKQNDAGLAEVAMYRSEAFPMVSFNSGASYVSQSLRAQGIQSSQVTSLFDRVDGYAFSWALSVQQPLITFGKVFSALKLARYQEKNLVNIRRLGRDMYFVSVMGQFANAYGAQYDVEIAESARQRSDRLLKRMRSELDGGRISRGDFLRIDAMAQNDRAQLIQARNAFSTALSRLVHLTGLENDTDFRLAIDDDGHLSLMPQEQESEFTQAVLKETEILMIEEQQRYIRAGALPSINLTGSIANQFMTIDTTGMTAKVTSLPTGLGINLSDANPQPAKFFDPDFFNYSIGAQLTWNIFDGNRTWAKYRQAKINAQKARIELEQIKERRKIDLQDARNQVTAIDSIEVAVALQVEAASKALTQTELDYADGRTDITAYLDVDREYRTALKWRDSLKIQKMLAIAQLRIAMGLPVYGE